MMRIIAALFPVKINGRVAGVVRRWSLVVVLALTSISVPPR
jgi:hypothetical protein